MDYGGKFTDRGNKRSAWNNWVSLMFKYQYKQFKDITKIAKRWQDEKLIEDIRTFDQIIKKNVKEAIKEKSLKKQKVTKDNEILTKCILPLNMITDYLMGKSKIKRDSEIELLNAIEAYSYYPTPQKYSEKLYKIVNDEWGNDVKIIDIGAGTASLSLPFIKNGTYSKLTMIEMNKAFSKYLKCFENFDRNIKVIETDIFDIPSNKLKTDIIIMNPPFEKNLYLMFILKAIDIIISNNGYLLAIYVICPNTNIDDTYNEIKIPQAMMKKFIGLETTVNKDYFIDCLNGENQLVRQIDYLGVVSGFRSISKRGQPIEIKQKANMYRFYV